MLVTYVLDQWFQTFFSLKPPLPVSKTSQAPQTSNKLQTLFAIVNLQL